MKNSIPSLALLATTLLAPAAAADGREPGSLLVYPVHRSGGGFFTIVGVTNRNTTPAGFGSVGGTTNVLFEYVNTVPNPLDSQLPLDCFVVDRLETLTPADTLSVLTTCHNAATAEGYLVVTATNVLTADGKEPWSFNYLMGSEAVVTVLGGMYEINALPFAAVGCDEDWVDDEADVDPCIATFLGGDSTDINGNGLRDFDGREYECLPDELYLDRFIAATGSSLTLINMSGGTQYTAVAKFDIWNDNEQPLSATKTFRCWFEESLQDVSDVFSESYLRDNTPHDPTELDLNCDGVGDLETGWAIITGLTASSSAATIPDPAFLGSSTAGPLGNINGGRLLWESREKQGNGEFLHFGTGLPPKPPL